MTGKHTDEEAARWIALRQSGDMTPERWREYREWLAQAPENRAAIGQYEKMLARMDSAGSDALAEEFERELNEAYEEKTAAQAARRMTARWSAIAAGIGALIAVAAVVFAAQPFFQRPVMYASTVGERISVALNDGSKATLNTNSTLSVRFSPGKRGVEVAQGEALFEVAKDQGRPFIVETPLATVQVTGTVFNVRSLPGETTVSVISGHVRVTPRGEAAVALTAGQELRIDETGAGETLAFDAANALAWRRGKARFEEASLEDVVADLNRYFPEPIVLADPALKDLPVTGEFDVTDQETAVAALTMAFDLNFREEDGRILLVPSAVP